MATSNPQRQKNFKPTIENSLLQATVDTINNVRWLLCCPLCGSVHQIMQSSNDELYTPLCQTSPALFKAQLVAWHKLYPDVVNFTSLHLMNKTAKAMG